MGGAVMVALALGGSGSKEASNECGSNDGVVAEETGTEAETAEGVC